MEKFYPIIPNSKVFAFLICLFLFFLNINLVSASEINGTIDSTYKYAWGENIGWINFACDNNKCNVSVTDTGLSGYAWNSQYGWINLNPSTSGVKNNGEGILSGYAWSSGIGWIDFNGVTVDSNGDFLGYATIKSDSSKINFNCINAHSCSSSIFKVKTDWRPASTRHVANAGGRGGHVLPVPSLVASPLMAPVITPIVNTVNNVSNNISEIVSSISDSIFNLFKPKNLEKSVAIEIPKKTPAPFSSKWNILPVKAISSFVFAPLPYEVRTLAAKFPELDQTLKSVGIERLSDMGKLSGVTFNIAGLTELEKTVKNVGVEKLSDINNINGVALNVPQMSNKELEKTLEALGVKQVSDLDKLNSADLKTLGMSNIELKNTLKSLGIEKITDLGNLTSVALSVPGFSNMDQNMINGLGAGKIALIPGLPVTKFPLLAKQNMPSEFVFARADGELVDLNVALSIGDKGEVTQRIASLPGKILKLVVKPISKARSVTGYFVFKSATPKVAENLISRASLSASALFSMAGLVEEAPKQVPVEEKLVLSSFEYTDPDHDGIYTADVASPVVPGEYEVVTVIDYLDPVLGTRQMRMIDVVDPEGYVYEKNNGKETRIPSAIVSLYYLNNSTKKYELWPAKDYQQDNPQVTDVRGTYSFLVPEGSYYFQIEAPGYKSYDGKVFVVAEGSGIHENIELKSDSGLLAEFDWKTILLIVVLLLLVYNLFKDKLSKFFKRS